MTVKNTEATFGEPGYDIVAGLRSDIKARVSDPIKFLAADEIERLRAMVPPHLLSCKSCKPEDHHIAVGAMYCTNCEGGCL
jgi:hypothetical protein